MKVKCSGRLLHKSRTVHRDLNPVWDESVTLPVEDPFQPLTIKVFSVAFFSEMLCIKITFVFAQVLPGTLTESQKRVEICRNYKQEIKFYALRESFFQKLSNFY